MITREKRERMIRYLLDLRYPPEGKWAQSDRHNFESALRDQTDSVLLILYESAASFVAGPASTATRSRPG